jgi:hypothetical protein
VPLSRIAVVFAVVAASSVGVVAVTDLERGSDYPDWVSAASWLFGACLWGLIAVGAVAVWRRR